MGAAIAGATVHLFWRSIIRDSTSLEYRSDRRAHTDRDGRAELLELRRPSSVQLLAEHDGYSPNWVRLRDLQGEVLEVELALEPASTLVMRLIDAESGEPLFSPEEPTRRGWTPAFPVWIGPNSGMRDHQVVTTEPDGTIRIAHPRPGTHTVGVYVTSHMPWSSEVTIPKEGSLDLGEIPLQAGPMYRVEVVDSQGEPIEGATVSIQPRRVSRRLDTVQTDAAGMAKLGPIGTSWVNFSVSHSAYRRYSEWGLKNEPSTEPVHLRAVLTPLSEVRGVLYGLDGEPLAEQRIALATSNGVTRHRTWTDEEGRFRIEQVSPGRYRFWVRQRNEQDRVVGESRDHWFEIGAEEVAEHDVYLQPPAHPTLTGTLRYENGGVAANMPLAWVERGGEHIVEQTTTDSQGRFEFWNSRRIRGGNTVRFRAKVEPERNVTFGFVIRNDIEPFDFDGGYDLGEVPLPPLEHETRTALRLTARGGLATPVPVKIEVYGDSEQGVRHKRVASEAHVEDLPPGLLRLTVDDADFPYMRRRIEHDDPNEPAEATLLAKPHTSVTFRVELASSETTSSWGRISIRTHCPRYDFSGPRTQVARDVVGVSLPRLAVGVEYTATIATRGYRNKVIRFTPEPGDEQIIEVTLEPE